MQEKIFYLSWSHCLCVKCQIIKMIKNERYFWKLVSLIIFSYFCLFFGLSLIHFEGSLILFWVLLKFRLFCTPYHIHAAILCLCFHFWSLREVLCIMMQHAYDWITFSCIVQYINWLQCAFFFSILLFWGVIAIVCLPQKQSFHFTK